jgi:LDH2 family malate/lactate/ureidoglycolate dehydrogenase
MFGAISIEAFMEPSEFKTRMDTALREIRNSERAPGVNRIYIPGEQSAEESTRRRRNGIPLPEAVITELVQLGDKLGVPFPS